MAVGVGLLWLQLLCELPAELLSLLLLLGLRRRRLFLSLALRLCFLCFCFLWERRLRLSSPPRPLPQCPGGTPIGAIGAVGLRAQPGIGIMGASTGGVHAWCTYAGCTALSAAVAAVACAAAAAAAACQL